MTSMEFCDWEPCGLLQEFIKKYALPLHPPATVQGVFVPAAGKLAQPKILTFYYCPFCGTRLHNNKEILEWISEARNQ
jgi:hypothetical protein